MLGETRRGLKSQIYEEYQRLQTLSLSVTTRVELCRFKQPKTKTQTLEALYHSGVEGQQKRHDCRNLKLETTMLSYLIIWIIFIMVICIFLKLIVCMRGYVYLWTICVWMLYIFETKKKDFWHLWVYYVNSVLCSVDHRFIDLLNHIAIHLQCTSKGC